MTEPDLVPDDMPARDVREEVHYRNHRAGYTTRSGGPIPPKIMSLNPWGNRKLNVWPRDKHGRLIE